MKTGIVMEVDERFLTLLTPDGEFLRARKLDRDYKIGQEIDFFPIDQEEIKKQSFFTIFNSLKAKTVFAAALIFMIVCVTLLPFFGENDVYAYMSIDVNPSIELGINENLQVIKIHSFNEDGEEIVKQLHDWEKKSIQEITREILHEIKVQGYTENNHEIVIGTVYTNKAQKDKENQRWEKEVAEIKNELENENLEIKIVKGSIKERNLAKEMGLSMGVYKEREKQENEKPKVVINEGREQVPEEEIREEKEKHEEKENIEIQKQVDKEYLEKEQEKRDREVQKQIEQVIREKEKQAEKENRERRKQIEKESKEREKQIEKESKEREKQMKKENDKREKQLERERKEEQKELKKEYKKIEKQKKEEEKQKNDDRDD